MALRYAILAAIAAAACGFQTPALNGIVGARMSADSQVSRRQLVQGAAGLAVGIIADKAANAASFDPNTGFPKNDGKKELLCNGAADKGCQPMTQSASILDKQKAILAGSITVGANKVSILDAEVASMQVTKKKKDTPKVDVPYVLRFSALYLSPLADAMEQYAARDAGGAKMAGGRGFPMISGPSDKEAAKSSPLYKYVGEVESGISELSAAAKKNDFAGITAASKKIKAAATSFLGASNAPVVFN